MAKWINPTRWPLHTQILVSLLLAFVVGLSSPLLLGEQAASLQWLSGTCSYIGQLFMQALKMITVPLVISSIIDGLMRSRSKEGGSAQLGKLGLKTLVYYTTTGLVAACIGLLMVNLFQPGTLASEEAASLLQQNTEEASAEITQPGVKRESQWKAIADILLRMIPPNIFEAATDNGQLLGLIVFSLLFGIFACRLPEELARFQEQFWHSVQQVILNITLFILRFAPIGVFALVTPVLIEEGFGIIGPVAVFFLTVLCALALHAFGALPLLVKLLTGHSPWRHLRTMSPVLMTAFSTASSASTLPLTMRTVRDGAGVSQRTSSFTLPLGATVNMDGTALYECIVVLFVAQLYASTGALAFGLVDQIYVVLLALATSIGVAGVPQASLVAITLILSVVGLPVEAIGIVLVVDRILDMCRTAVNVFSDTCGAVIIGTSEKEDIYAGKR